MAVFRFLRRRLSPLFGWGRNRTPTSATETSADPLDALADWLGAAGSAGPPGDASARVSALDQRYGVRIPEDFRRYLVYVAPAAVLVDDHMTEWWTLDRIRSLPEEYEHEVSHPEIAAEAGAYLFFADYLIWCWAWAVCCSEGPNRGRVAFIGGADGFVADSFTEFVERYLRNPASMANTFPPRRDAAGPASG